jgi:hypothetical protein
MIKTTNEVANEAGILGQSLLAGFKKLLFFFALSKHLIVSYLRQLISLAKTMLAQPIHAHDSTSCGT